MAGRENLFLKIWNEHYGILHQNHCPKGKKGEILTMSNAWDDRRLLALSCEKVHERLTTIKRLNFTWQHFPCIKFIAAMSRKKVKRDTSQPQVRVVHPIKADMKLKTRPINWWMNDSLCCFRSKLPSMQNACFMVQGQRYQWFSVVLPWLIKSARALTKNETLFC